MTRRALPGSLLLLLLVPLLLVVSGAPASACSCVSASVAEHRRQADAVFSGEVLERSGGRDGVGSVTYTVRVDRVFKGEVAAEQEVLSGAQSSACGIELEAAQRALFFAHSAESGSAPARLSTSSCSGTRPGGGGRGLGAGHPPTGGSTDPSPAEVSAAGPGVPQDHGLPVLGLLGLVPLLGVGALALQRRRPATQATQGRGPRATGADHR